MNHLIIIKYVFSILCKVELCIKNVRILDLDKENHRLSGMYVCITFMYDSNVKPTLCMSHLQRATKGVCTVNLVTSCYILH